MPEFLDENLTPEELKGGFEPTDKDDETFLLESIENYPGILPYEIEFTDEAQIPKETSEKITQIKSSKDEEESLDEALTSTKNYPLKSDDEIKTYEKSGLVGEGAEQVPYGKSGLVGEETEQVSYERSGLVGEETEQVSYERSGLVGEGAEQVSYEKSGLVGEGAEQVPYERSGITRNETQTVGEPSLRSVWDLFEEETTPTPEDTGITQEISIKDEQGIQELSHIEPTATEETTEGNIVEPIASEAFPEGIEEPPTEISIVDYNEEEFSEVLDEDFRKEIEGELEQSRERKGKIEKESEHTAGELTTAEKEELQKDLDGGVERIGVADFIEIDLTAMEVKKPSEFLAYEMREKVDFADFLKATPKEKKAEEVQKQTKSKKKVKKPKKAKVKQPIAMGASEVGEIPKKGAPMQVEEPQRWEKIEELPAQVVSPPKEEPGPTETKKKRLIPIWVWFPAAAVILLFIAVGGYFLLSEKFGSKKKVEVAKTEIVKKKEQKDIDLLKNDKPSGIITPPVEKKVTPSGPEQIAEKHIKSEPKPEQTAEPDIKKESKPKISLTQQARTEPKFKTDLKPEKSSIASIEKPSEPPVAKIIESVSLAEYSIEVFSSSEPDEANYWKNILNKKGIDALIKIHKVRNVDVYCVRVGTFKNIDEARAYAKSKGFKNIWIDRIK